MAQKITKFVVAIVFAMATLLPAWGQDAPAVVTTTVGNLKFGVDPTDNTLTWITTLRLVNRTQNMHNAVFALKDGAGNPFPCVLIDASGNPSGSATDIRSALISPIGELRYPCQGISGATAVPVTLTAQSLRNSDGLGNVIVEALVQQVDSKGKILQSYESVDASTVSTATGKGFAIATDLGSTGNDTTLLFSNPGSGVVMATVSVYDGFNNASSMDNRKPVASMQIPLSPGMAAQTLSQLFSASQDFANFASQVSGNSNLILGQNLVTVTSDQPFALAVSRANSSPDGSVIQTSSNFFALAPPPVQQ